MIRELEKKHYSEDKFFVRLAGLSSDSKPTEDIVTGSEFLEVDMGARYFFDETTEAWYAETNATKTSIIDATVTLGSSLSYTGSELTQAVSTVVIGETTLTADTDYKVVNNKATLPGTYMLYIVGKGSYAGVLPVEFTVSKAAGSVTASPDSLSLTEGGDAGTSTITVTGDGEVSVESSAAAVATAELEDTTVTVTPVAEGSATVTVTLSETALYEGATDTISVTVEAAPEPDPDSEPSEP